MNTYLPNSSIHFQLTFQSDIVEFYYLWKKLQDGLMLQPQGKHRRQAAMKRISKAAAAETGINASEHF